MLARDHDHELVEQRSLRAQHLPQPALQPHRLDPRGLFHDVVPQRRVTNDIAPQHRIQAHATTRRATRLCHRLRRDRGGRLSPFDTTQAVVDRRRDGRAQPRHILRVLVNRGAGHDSADTNQDRLLDLVSARTQTPYDQPNTATHLIISFLVSVWCRGAVSSQRDASAPVFKPA